MLKRQTTGSIVCRSCGLLVGVNDAECYECGCRNPGLWGFAPLLRALGDDLGFLGSGYLGMRVSLSGDAWPWILPALGWAASSPCCLRAGKVSSSSALVEQSPSSRPVAGGPSSVLPGCMEGCLHIGFNLMWVRQLAPTTAMIYGPARMVIIYTVSSIIGFSLSSWAGGFLGFLPGPLRGAGFTVGASAPIFGLLGALIYAGRRGVGSAIDRQAQSYAIILFVLGLIMSSIDNWAHVGGFLGGYLTSRWLDPMQPERLNHLVAGLICIGLTILSIVASVVNGIQYV